MQSYCPLPRFSSKILCSSASRAAQSIFCCLNSTCRQVAQTPSASKLIMSCVSSITHLVHLRIVFSQNHFDLVEHPVGEHHRTRLARRLHKTKLLVGAEGRGVLRNDTEPYFLHPQLAKTARHREA